MLKSLVSVCFALAPPRARVALRDRDGSIAKSFMLLEKSPSFTSSRRTFACCEMLALANSCSTACMRTKWSEILVFSGTDREMSNKARRRNAHHTPSQSHAGTTNDRADELSQNGRISALFRRLFGIRELGQVGRFDDVLSSDLSRREPACRKRQRRQQSDQSGSESDCTHVR